MAGSNSVVRSAIKYVLVFVLGAALATWFVDTNGVQWSGANIFPPLDVQVPDVVTKAEARVMGAGEDHRLLHVVVKPEGEGSRIEISGRHSNHQSREDIGASIGGATNFFDYEKYVVRPTIVINYTSADGREQSLELPLGGKTRGPIELLTLHVSEPKK